MHIIKFLSFTCLFLSSTCLLAQQTKINQNKDSVAYELYLTQIALSESLLQMGEIADAKATLDKTDPKFRGWEWKYLHATLDRSAKTLSGSGTPLSFVAFGPDGKLLASCGADSTVLLWDFEENIILKKMAGHKGGVSTLDFSPDGRYLASGARDKTVKIWDLVTGAVLKTLTENLSQGIYSVKFSPDGKLLGVTSWRRDPVKTVIGFALIFDVATGALLKNFDLDNHPVSAIDFSPDGKKALIGSWGEIAYYYDLDSGNLEWQLDMSDPEEYNAINSADISPDGKWAAITGKDYTTRVLEAATGKLLYEIEKHEGHRKWINTVRFSPDGKWLATAGEDAILQVREAATGKLAHTFRGHDDFIHALAWHPFKPILATASKDGFLKIWDLGKPAETTFDACDNGPWYAPVSPDGKWVATACSDKYIGIWNVETGAREKLLEGKSANCGVFSPDGKSFASGGHDHTVRVWDIQNEKEILTLEGHINSIYGMAWSGGFLASAGDTTVRIWDAASGKALKILAFSKKSAYAVTFSPDGERLVAGMSNGDVYVFSTKNWKELAHWKPGTDLKYIHPDESGKRLIISDKNVLVLDLENGNTLELKGHKSAIWGAEFHPDGRYAVSCSYDQTVRFWDTHTGRCTLTLHGFSDELFKVSVLKDGKGILVTETQGVIHTIDF